MRLDKKSRLTMRADKWPLTLLIGVCLVGLSCGGSPDVKADLKISAAIQKNCAPLSFLVENRGGSNTGPFDIEISEVFNDGTRRLLDKVAVTTVMAKESLSFDRLDAMTNGNLEISVDPLGKVDELSKGNNKIRVEKHCIR